MNLTPFSTGSDSKGKACQLALVLFKKAMPDETVPPRKVVFRFTPVQIQLDITHDIEGGHEATRFFKLEGKKVRELIGDCLEEDVAELTLIVEHDAITTVLSRIELREGDEFLEALHGFSMLVADDEELAVVSRNWDE